MHCSGENGLLAQLQVLCWDLDVLMSAAGANFELNNSHD